MKKWRLLLGSCLLLGSAGAAGAITGRVFEDVNADGVFDAGDLPLPNLLLSDGFQFVRSGADGTFAMEPAPDARFAMLHVPSEFRVRCFYRFLAGETFDFALTRVPAAAGVRILQVADQESPNLDWLPEVKERGELENVDFYLATGDLCRFPDIAVHAREFNAGTMGREVFYTVGNHDLVPPQPDGRNYQDYLGPFWYSFERGGIIFIAAPIHYGETPLPYDLADYGDWLDGLMKELPPEQPKVLIGHYLPDWRDSMIVAGHDGRQVDLEQYHLTGAIYGHAHHNMARNYSNSPLRAFCTNAPNKGGIEYDPNCVRLIAIAPTGEMTGQLVWSGLSHHLQLTVPGLVRPGEPDELAILATAYHSGGTVVKMTAAIQTEDGESIETDLKPVNSWSYQAALPALPARPDAAATVTVRGEFSDGTVEERRAPLLPGVTAAPAGNREWHNLLGDCGHNGYLPGGHRCQTLQLQWFAASGEEFARCSPVVAEGRVFIASHDDSNGTEARLYAYDAVSGHLLWSNRIGTSVKGALAYGDGKIYLNDTRGTLYAYRAADGEEVWREIPPWQLNPTNSGVVCADGVIYAGSGPSFRAVDARNGSVIWRNEAWPAPQSFTGAPTVAGDVVIGCSNWAGLFAHDRRNGKLRWKYDEGRDRILTATPVYADGLIWFKSENDIVAVDPSSGKEARRIATGEDLRSAAPLVITPELILAGTTDRGLCAFDKTTGKQRWRFEAQQVGLLDTAAYHRHARTIDGGLLAIGDQGVFGANDGIFYLINLADGSVIRQFPLGSPVLTAPATDGQRIYIADLAGRLFAFAGQ